MTATERAYAFTKERVLDSTFAGGDLLTEGDVAEALGLSRTPVREAFLRLQGEGLLRLYPKRGAMVVPVSVGEVDAVMETRVLVERFAIGKLLAAGPAPALAGRLADAIARQRRVAAAGDIEGFVAVDREFHTIFVSAADNAIVSQIYDSLRDRQQRMVTMSLLRDERRIASILVEHEAIADAIRDGDSVRAKRALVRHLQRALELLRGA